MVEREVARQMDKMQEQMVRSVELVKKVQKGRVRSESHG